MGRFLIRAAQSLRNSLLGGFLVDILLMRHAEASSSHMGSEVISSEPSLTPLGRKQALRAAAFLQHVGIERIYCSPMLRSLETAALVGNVLSFRPYVWPLLAERGLGGANPGLRRSEILEMFPQVYLPPEVDEDGWARHWDGETPEQLDARMSKVKAELFERARTDDLSCILCVGHGGSMSALLRHFFGVRPDSRLRFVHDNCGITPLRFEDDWRHGSPKCTVVNERRHLIGLDRDEIPAGVSPTCFTDWWSIPTKPWPPE